MTAAAPADSIRSYLEVQRPEVDRALVRAVEDLAEELSPGVHDAVRHGVTSGGKRLRPVLCIAAFEACGGAPDATTYDLAASIELIHAYSLMHDDLPCMDDADLRRGVPTTHVAHGEEITTVAGAALIPAAIRQAFRAATRLGLEDAAARAVARELARAAGAGGMVGGQWHDLLAEGQLIDSDELDRLHGRKTGALLTSALVIGGMAGRASPPQLEALRAFGRAIGLAFQIADDVLDATGSAEGLGKNPSDAELDKSTYVALHGVEGARAHAAGRVAEGLSALERGGLHDAVLRDLARYVIERRK